MSGLLKQPALWPVLALNPEPSMDPDDPARWYLELFTPGPSAVNPAPQARPQQAQVKPSRYVSPAPSKHLNQFVRRR